MDYFDARLQTFDKKQKTFFTDHDFAEAGFYWTENSTAKCFSCGLDINFSNIKQHPWITHALFMEKCDHVLRTKGNEFIVRYKRIKSTGSAVARSPVRTQSLHVQTEELPEYSSVQAQGSISPTVTKSCSSQMFQSLRIADDEINKKMSIEKNRILSFGENWPHKLPTAKSFAKAGFYSTGDDDIVKCFCCGVEYGNWKEDFIPMQVHVKDFTQQCKFVLEILKDAPKISTNLPERKEISKDEDAISLDSGFGTLTRPQQH